MKYSASTHRYELEDMEDFLTYDEKDLADDKNILIQSIIDNTKDYLTEEEIKTIRRTYHYANQAHHGQTRLSGEEYITHPLRATQILLSLRPDCATIQACILHDVIEDTPTTYHDINKEFWEEVAKLCEWLVKVSKVRYQWEDRSLETLKKTFLAMANDLRVIFIKLADRIHNIQTLHFHPKEEKKVRIAQETLKIYVPICKKLGLYQFQLYLENGVFKILHPEEYRQVMAFLKKKYNQSDKHITKGIYRIGKILQEDGLHHYTITGRTKSPYRIYEKLMTKYHNLDFSKVLDVIWFRIVTNSIPDCYNALGIVHAHFNPLINKIKDYIAVPKANNYQSLHTTVLGMYPFPVEIQIRTRLMNDIAEFWVAAHYAYKERYQNPGEILTQRQSQRLANIQESVSKYQTLEKEDSFKDKLSIEILDNNIFVYTPKGEVIELPKGSTVLDFAFRVHSEVWLKFNNATVNDIIKPIGHILQSGDIIHINTFKNRYTATKYRFDYLHMPSAKSKLLKFLKQQEKDIYISKWLEILNSKLQKNKLPLLGNNKDKIQKHLWISFEHTLMQIATKAIQPLLIIKEVYGNNITETWKWGTAKEDIKIIPFAPSWQDLEKIIVDDQPFLHYDLCPLCKPQPWQKVIARSGKDWLLIHTMKCKALSTVNYNKLIKAHRWGTHIENSIEYYCTLTIIIPNQWSNIISLMTVFQELDLQIDSVKIDKSPDNSEYKVTVASSYTNPSKIAYIINYLNKHYPHIISLSKEIK